MFRRREKPGFWGRLRQMVYPRGGWWRAATYIWHRLRRLPDSPHRIARGIGAGVFVSFTPLFGLHFVLAALIALVIRGNVLAAVLATFFGNPVTFPVIAAASLKLGALLLGTGDAAGHLEPGISVAFWEAFKELGDNIMVAFSGGDASWGRLVIFFREVFLPYLVGGTILGLPTAIGFSLMSAPVIAAYQHRRRGRLARKLAELRAAREARRLAEEGGNSSKAPDGVR